MISPPSPLHSPPSGPLPRKEARHDPPAGFPIRSFPVRLGDVGGSAENENGPATEVTRPCGAP